MKKVGVLLITFFLIGFYSCKECPECPKSPEVSISSGHEYKKNIGKMSIVDANSRNNYFENCLFNTKESKFYRKVLKNTDTYKCLDDNTDHSFYDLIFSSTIRPGRVDTFLLLHNDSLDIDQRCKENNIKNTKGSLGCFPKFIIISDNNGSYLDYFEIGGKRFIQLPFGYHDENNHHEIPLLVNLDFEISQIDYNKLNELLRHNIYYQGGIDIENPYILKLFYANGNNTNLTFTK